MSLSLILAALKRQLIGVAPLFDGPEHLVERSAPSIVAVPGDEVPGEPEYYDAAAPLAVAQRNAEVLFDILGEERSDTEELLRRLMVAIKTEVLCAFRWGAAGWKARDSASVTTFGRGYELRVTFFIPVTADPVQAGVVRTTEQTTEFAPHPAQEP